MTFSNRMLGVGYGLLAIKSKVRQNMVFSEKADQKSGVKRRSPVHLESSPAFGRKAVLAMNAKTPRES